MPRSPLHDEPQAASSPSSSSPGLASWPAASLLSLSTAGRPVRIFCGPPSLRARRRRTRASRIRAAHRGPVDPDTMEPVNRLSRRQRRDAAAAAAARAKDRAGERGFRGSSARLPSEASGLPDHPDYHGEDADGWRDQMLRGINDIVAKKSDADDEDWNSSKGPLPVIKSELRRNPRYGATIAKI